MNTSTRKRAGLGSALCNKATLAVASLQLAASQALGQGLPTTAPPSRGETDGNYIQMIRDYGFDIITVVALGIACFAFIVVAKNVIGAYSEVQDGKGTWGQLGMQFGIGALLLVFVVYLASQAVEIL